MGIFALNGIRKLGGGDWCGGRRLLVRVTKGLVC